MVSILKFLRRSSVRNLLHLNPRHPESNSSQNPFAVEYLLTSSRSGMHFSKILYLEKCFPNSLTPQ